jgi:hypothetical protein
MHSLWKRASSIPCSQSGADDSLLMPWKRAASEDVFPFKTSCGGQPIPRIARTECCDRSSDDRLVHLIPEVRISASVVAGMRLESQGLPPLCRATALPMILLVGSESRPKHV